ncbi:MAG: glucose-6-phosphate dehydrogenase [Arenicellales bacterium]|jgi:glucose-6-phosphate 1-dehydrogenase|nr:glucose-6-phosphate dehydrogenase [Gammaproteobacteria bacterium]MDP7618063.1 glucose-6-phosphate dehydrogenase [Arenicellales bacterium]HJP26874.1 glucose-6-phosphate dehydrogenase [Arenicellales bacterium]|tara:strand:- start:2641 stop:4113 length:1473 start_codon:yes stop_codon:yes gene_type:complete
MAKLVPVDIFDLIIFGGTGDLAMRKLLPALYHRDRDNQIMAGSRIIAVGRSDLTRDGYIDMVEKALRGNLAQGEFDGEHWKTFSSRIEYARADLVSPDEWTPLCDLLSGKDDRIRVAYLATAPTLFGTIARGMQQNGLITGNSRIVLEKPLGRDFLSASDINNAVGECFSENQIYRIDHYLGKETVQNLLALRFANSLFEPLWRRGAVDHVQITVAEDLGVGGRIEFYDRIGALRDMVQNHLLQLVCLTAMEAPASLHHDAVRDEKIKVLRALRPINAETVRANSVRGQYTSGAIRQSTVPGYLDELGNQDSRCETFVALKVEIDNWRWSNVPFYLRTGKRLQGKHSEIVIQFQDIPHSIFAEQEYNVNPNRLTIRLQPDEGVKLSVMAKEPGPGGFELRPVALDLSFEETFGIRYPDAYERLLMEVLRGNPALFMRRDEVEAAWNWIDGIIDGWENTNQKVEPYIAGSWGPSASSLLLDRDGRAWYPNA